MEVSCDTCAYWADDGDGSGECRRHAPRPRPTDEVTHWPSTLPDDWCGDWEDGEPICGCDDDEACEICEPDATDPALDEAFTAIVQQFHERRRWWQKGRNQ